MKYEVTVVVELHPEAAFFGTDGEMEEVYSLVESAITDIDDLQIRELEVREYD
jgi:hypothetical protein